MQKAISYFLLFFSLLLLFLAMTQTLFHTISSFPPFTHTQSSYNTKQATYSGSTLSIADNKEPSQLYAKAYCLFDADSQRILYAKNENKKLPMASTTKIMTCIIAIENCDLNSKVPVSSYAASMPDVQLNMQAGDSFILGDLLYSLMLESHNDTAVAIAEFIGKSVKGFATLMNNKARELGCTKTNFVTPNGLDDAKHYTTAKELCIIASYAIQNKTFQKIIQTKSHQFSNCKKNRQYTVNNHDAFLSNYSGAIGIKTGFTGKAGYCFCGAAKKDGRILVSSVLACGWPPHKSYKWSDTKALMDYGFNAFKQADISTPDYPDKSPVLNSTLSSIHLTTEMPSKFTLPLSKDDKIIIKRNMPGQLSAPIRQGDILGYDAVYLNGKLLKKYAILAKENAYQRTFHYYRKIILDSFFFRTLR